MTALRPLVTLSFRALATPGVISLPLPTRAVTCPICGARYRLRDQDAAPPPYFTCRRCALRVVPLEAQ